ncbi:kunitz-type protease inhibitor 4 [Crotalus adamanteus]|uniref:Kunitz-type protease inhibitor 4 n=1 Tax=Crotalus adamanteus TaxID=8729 RepID=A0AAW1BTK1_CROAD
MRSGGSLLHLLLLLFWGDFALCIPELILADSYDGNCFQFHENLKQCGEPVDRFFYNVINERCETFVDYGCPARLNRYISMEQCLEYCDPKSKPSCGAGRSQVWGPGGKLNSGRGLREGGGLLSPCGKRPNPALHPFF